MRAARKERERITYLREQRRANFFIPFNKRRILADGRVLEPSYYLGNDGLIVREEEIIGDIGAVITVEEAISVFTTYYCRGAGSTRRWNA